MTANEVVKRSDDVRVVIVDDHPMMREGTRAALEQQGWLEVVATTGEGMAVPALVAEFEPHVLLLDVRLPDVSGIEVARRVRAEHPHVAIIVISGYDNRAYAPSLLRMGVRGLLSKTLSGGEIAAAIRTVLDGGLVIATDSGLSEPPSLGATFGLTGREQDVLELVAAGLRNAEIAMRLGVTVKAVEFHVGNVLRKLDVRSRAEVVRKARDLGLASEPLTGAAESEIRSL